MKKTKNRYFGEFLEYLLLFACLFLRDPSLYKKVNGRVDVSHMPMIRLFDEDARDWLFVVRQLSPRVVEQALFPREITAKLPIINSSSQAKRTYVPNHVSALLFAAISANQSTTSNQSRTEALTAQQHQRSHTVQRLALPTVAYYCCCGGCSRSRRLCSPAASQLVVTITQSEGYRREWWSPGLCKAR